MPGDEHYRDLKVSGRRNRRASLLLGALLAALLVLPAPAQAAFPGANGKIAFSRDATNNGMCDYQIDTINPDGTGLTSLTSATSANLDPAWSADGQKLAFVRNASVDCNSPGWSQGA